MKPILIILSSLFIFSSCHNDDNNNIQNEIPVDYFFAVDTIYGAKNDEERIVEFEIDGIRHRDIAPCFWHHRKFTSSIESNIKVNIIKKKGTHVYFKVRKNIMHDNNGNIITSGKLITNTSFRDQLDTIVKIK